jgi:hypothetical protein
VVLRGPFSHCSCGLHPILIRETGAAAYSWHEFRRKRGASMSRVRDAIKRVDDDLFRQRGVLVVKSGPDRPRIVSPPIHPVRRLSHSEPPEAATQPGPPLVQAVVSLSQRGPQEVTCSPMASLKNVLGSFLSRVIGRIQRRYWRRTGFPVPRCNGLTRAGMPCRAPAMANGFCRMHGGSRNGKIAPAAPETGTLVAPT